MSDIARSIGEIVARHIAAKEIAGAVTLLSRSGRVECLDAQGVADFDPNFTLQPDSIFGAMSMTKPVTAACAALLIAEGRMSPSDPVSRWIPEFAVPRTVRTPVPDRPPAGAGGQPVYVHGPALREITVHDLMSFTSGLQTIGIDNPAIPPVRPQDSLASWVARLGEVPLEFQPGTQWHYSNATGYDVLGRIIEIVSGQGFDVFAGERLFDPLGMIDTGFGVREGLAGRLVPLGPLAQLPVMRHDYPSGSAGLLTTAADYARFAQMLLDDGAFEGKRILPASAVALMRTNQIGKLAFPGMRAAEYTANSAKDRSGLRYGYGVGLVTGPSEGIVLPAGSFGWDGIGTRRFWAMPSRRAVLVMLMPGIGAAADATHMEIEQAVCRALD